MIEEGLFSKFLKPLIQKRSEKDALVNVLDSYIKVPYTLNVRGFEIKIQKISATQKKELLLYKDKIEKDLEGLLSKKYNISF